MIISERNWNKIVDLEKDLKDIKSNFTAPNMIFYALTNLISNIINQSRENKPTFNNRYLTKMLDILEAITFDDEAVKALSKIYFNY